MPRKLIALLTVASLALLTAFLGGAGVHLMVGGQ